MKIVNFFNVDDNAVFVAKYYLIYRLKEKKRRYIHLEYIKYIHTLGIISSDEQVVSDTPIHSSAIILSHKVDLCL